MKTNLRLLVTAALVGHLLEPSTTVVLVQALSLPRRKAAPTKMRGPIVKLQQAAAEAVAEPAGEAGGTATIPNEVL